MEKPKRIRGPLIPTTVLDPVSQRTFCTALLALLQAWKVYDLILIKSGLTSNGWLIGFAKPETSFVIKYLFLDGLFLWTLPFLRIPKLTYTALATALQILAISFVTVVATMDWISPVVAILGGVQGVFHHEKELTFTGDTVDEAWDQSSHFKGRKTIRILPDSTAKLNPYNTQFCLKNTYNSHVNIPLRLNSTTPVDNVELEYRSFDNEVSVFNYTSRQLRKLFSGDYAELRKQENDDRISFLELPVSQPGYYRLRRVSDNKQKTLRVYKSDVFVPVCPSARFSGDTPDSCVGDSFDSLSISVFGVPPFTLVYNEEINGELSKLPNSIAQPDDFESPLLKKDYYTGSKQPKVFAREELVDISWADTTSIIVPISSSRLEKAGKYIYTISKVIDGFGNVVEYVPDEHSKDVFHEFTLHPVPIATLKDDHTPLISGKTKHLEIKLSQVACPSCEGPFVANISSTNEKGKLVYRTEKFDYKRPALIPVTKGGVYTLENMKSKFCPVKVSVSSVNVLEAEVPKVNITAEPVVDKCVGTTGYHFNLAFVGTPPFEIAYKITGLDKKNSHQRSVQTLKSDSSVLTYEYKPPSEGSFAIEFLSLRDKYYRDPVKFAPGQFSYKTFFQQRPQVTLVQNDLVLCNGASASLPVALQGKTPFKLRYQVSSLKNVETFEVEDITDVNYIIETPNFTEGGEYKVSIREASDSSHCDVEIGNRDVTLRVKHEVPTIRFKNSQKLSITQGKTVNVPLLFSTGNLVELTYRHTDFGGKEKTKQVRLNPVDGFPVEEAGVYSIVEFKEGECQGRVSDEKLTVVYDPKPFVTIPPSEDIEVRSNSSFEIKTLCESCSGSFDVHLNGQPPFIIEHSVVSPSGHVETKNEQVFKNHMTVQLRTSESGVYKYVINQVADSIYAPDVMKKLKGSERIEILNFVSPSPRAAFSRSESAIKATKPQYSKLSSPVYKACMGNLQNQALLEPIPIVLSGRAPFTIKVAVEHEPTDSSEILEFTQIESTHLENYAIYENLKIGTNVVRLVEVSDSNGCVQTEFGAHDEVIVAVNDVPKIKNILDDDNLAEVPYYCVGDHVTYLMSGIPPFTVFYQFNDLKQKVDLESNVFKRLASKPGELAILAIADSSANCLVNFTLPEQATSRPDLRAKIYDMPSVEISQGESIEEDIHEGEFVEIVFTFTGHPPFTLTYTRTEPISKHRGDATKVVETEVVENIYDYEYRIWTRLEGTYEAIELQDAHCLARNHRM